MPNIASVLKTEIARVARKELRMELQSLRKASTQYRSEIAALKRRIASLEQQAKRQRKAGGQRAAAPQAEEDDSPSLRFSAGGFATLRKRLDLSAAKMGALLGVSGQSVYKWETGKARPRASQLAAISAARKLGKREAMARLEAVASE